MRIAIVSTYPPGKGSLNEYGYHFIRFLRTKNEVTEVIVLTDELPEGETYSTEDPIATVPMRVTPCWQFNSPINAFRIVRTIRQTHPDIVLFNLQFTTFGSRKIASTLGLMTPALVRMLGVPTIVLLHNIMETVNLQQAGFTSNWLMEKIIRGFGTIVTWIILRANLVALTIPKYVELIEAKYRAPNVVLAPHGAFEAAPSIPTETLSNAPQQIMTFGKFGTYKKVETLIEAFRLLQDDTRPGLELVIAGSDNPNAPGYLDTIRQNYNDVPNIRFTGYVAEEDVPQLFKDATVVVFPYTSTTGSSGVLHQAGNYGKAVVLPNLGDLAELITDEGYAGEFFTPEDPQSLATAIAHVIDNPQRRYELEQQNHLAACGLPMTEVVDWYLFHAQHLFETKKHPTSPLLNDDQLTHQKH